MPIGGQQAPHSPGWLPVGIGGQCLHEVGLARALHQEEPALQGQGRLLRRQAGLGVAAAGGCVDGRRALAVRKVLRWHFERARAPPSGGRLGWACLQGGSRCLVNGKG